jgi:4-hydroxy-4-methyl-2-oxoglutarate aldolase
VVETGDMDYFDGIAERFPTAVLADVMDAQGRWHQTMSFEIQPLFEGARIAGRAATMLAAEVYEVHDDPYKLELELQESLSPGDVVVCTTQGSDRAAMWGEMLSIHARAKGGRGAIVDGLARDSAAIAALRFPVFARGVTPADNRGRIEVIAIRVPIEVGGVRVQHGDLVVADRDGCVVVPASIEAAVVEAATRKTEGEDAVRAALERGTSMTEVYEDHGAL